MKKQQTRLSLNKKTVSVLQSKDMYVIRGGADVANVNGVDISALAGITKPQSDSFVACGSCFGDCATNSTACVQQISGVNNVPFNADTATPLAVSRG